MIHNKAPIPCKSSSSQTESNGYCQNCKTIHRLESSKAVVSCRQLIELIERKGTIDLFGTNTDKDDRLKTEYLFGPARGKMFGVMKCMQTDGTTTVIRAFSGQYNGTWLVDGWVPPLFDVDDFFRISDKIEKQIKSISREIESLEHNSKKWLLRRKKRRLLSQSLMRDIHNLYQLTNFHGETASLSQAFYKNHGMPTGTGDCCAPKLLNHAVKHQLIPLGIAEFYWGRENKSASRQHGIFYSSCIKKCEPILGFMLCGLDHHGKYSTT